ncbi:MAG TPA: hypothetical protein VJT73_12320 [Polyangiaceae bacterium]|nr:hypothetical protein [Polyangiaceae bacterium]
MTRPAKFSIALGLLASLAVAFVVHSRATFPKDTTPEGSYARIVLAVTRGTPGECFAYLETQAQWASFTIGDFRAKAAARIATAYPEPERSERLAAYKREAEAHGGPEIWSAVAQSRGWIARLRKDLSGIKEVAISGERATVETARGTRYTFRKRDNGIWGLTMFTAELLAEAEKAARDFEMVSRAADDYERAAAPER